MISPGRSDSLPGALKDWRVSPQRDPQFRSSVWQRIEAGRREASWRGYARAHAGFVAGALAVALMAGGWAGREQARARAEADRATIATAYVRALDARAMHLP